MCLIYLAHRVHPQYPLVVAANRDEMHDRPAEPAHWWPQPPGLLAGRDRQAGGTWMGMSRRGRFAAITNYREPGPRDPTARSRGELVSRFLLGAEDVLDYLRGVAREADHYNGFSLLVHDGRELACFSNRGGPPERVAPGVHGLSNHLLDTPWPKVEEGKLDLLELLTRRRVDRAALLALMDHREASPDEALPDSGVGLERERILSPRFIVDPVYGTRCTTLALWGRDGHVHYAERSFDARGEARGDVVFDFLIDGLGAPDGVTAARA